LILFPAGALASGFAWRAEIELRGWAGLAWIGWFHWALPAGLALFVGSAVFVSRRRLSRRRLALAAVGLAALAAAGSVATRAALFFLFQRTHLPPAATPLDYLGALAFLALVPTLVAAAVAAFGLGPGVARWLTAQALWAGAIPAVEAALGVGFVEAIKTGWPVPWLYLALGLLFLPRASSPAGSDPGALPAEAAPTQAGGGEGCA
jgi:hypothetical protein